MQHLCDITMISFLSSLLSWISNFYVGNPHISLLGSNLVKDLIFNTTTCGHFKVVTCGNVPLESSFQKVPRCVYTSTSLYEYRGWDSKAANPSHRRFTWGLRSLEVRCSLYYETLFTPWYYLGRSIFLAYETVSYTHLTLPTKRIV